jgi:hypothetical protein
LWIFFVGGEKTTKQNQTTTLCRSPTRARRIRHPTVIMEVLDHQVHLELL